MRSLRVFALAVVAPAVGRADAGPLGALVRSRMVAEVLDSTGRVRPDELRRAQTPADRLIASQRPDGSWPDIPYANREPSLWPPIQHLDRVYALAQAWRQDPRDGAALGGAIRGLDYWLRTDPRSTNWWWQTIGMQQHLVPPLLLLRDQLPPADFRAACRLLRRSHVDGMTGANLAWEAGNLFALGALTDDTALMRDMLNRITDGIAVSVREGIQPDWSFHQHGPQLNAGNYGLSFLETCGRYAQFVRGTVLQVPPEKTARLDQFALQFQDWVVWGRHMDLSSCGRQLDLPDCQTRKADALADDARRLLGLNPVFDGQLRALIGRIAGGAGRGSLVGNRYYWRSDFLVHRTPAWYVSVKMYSPRVLRTETSVNQENFLGFHLCDGATFILVRGDEYENIQPVWDWRRLPGITARAAAGPLPYGVDAPAQRNPEAFVGGVSDGVIGAAALDIAKDGVHARKAWFCFTQGVVCLGAAVRSAQPEPVITSLNQCLLRGPVAVRSPAGWSEWRAAGQLGLPRSTSAVFHDGVGYVFLQPAEAVLSAGPQTGAWTRLRHEGVSADPVSRDVFSLGIDHGIRPTAGGYAYALLPATDRAGTERFIQAPWFQVLANSSDLQAVLAPAEQRLEAAFRAPGRLALPDGTVIAVDAPCLLLVHLEGVHPAVFASDPTQKLKRIRITVGPDIHTVALPHEGLAGSTVGIPPSPN